MAFKHCEKTWRSSVGTASVPATIINVIEVRKPSLKA